MLKGSIVALITPFTNQKEINYPKLKELIEFQYQNQTQNLLILGTTSESPTLSDTEKNKLVSYIVKQNKKRMKLVVAITENATSSAIHKAKKYQSLGADYLLVITPFYNKGNEEGIIKHFTQMADSVNIPLILYNIPGRTGVNLDASMISRLKNHPRIIGVKEANRNLSHILDINHLCDDKFSLYCGNDDLLILFKGLKAKGYFNVYGNLNPQIMNEFYFAPDINQLFSKHYPLLKLLFVETNPIPIKALMNFQGFKVGGYRLPLAAMNEDNYQKLVDAYKSLSNLSEVS